MFIESLIRLAEIIDYFESTNTKLISENFHKQTRDLIDHQNKFLMNELSLLAENPGPYNFGFGELQISFFSPQEMDDTEWAAIARYKDWQKNYRFNSPMGMIKVLSEIIKDTNGSTTEQTGTSSTENTDIFNDAGGNI